MKKTLRKMMTTALVSLVSFSMLAACGKSRSSRHEHLEASAPSLSRKASLERAGSVILAVNPEVEIEYDDQGRVIEIEGRNDDGREVAMEYRGFEGLPAEEAAAAVVKEMHELGFFEAKLAGKTRNIVIRSGENSEYPTEDFLENVAEHVRAMIQALSMQNQAMLLETKDLDDTGSLTYESAKRLLLAQVGLNLGELKEEDFDKDDGRYEFEFVKDGLEYEFEVDAQTGKVTEVSIESQTAEPASQTADLDDDKDDIDDKDDLDDRDDDKDDIDDKDDLDDQDDDKDDVDDKDDLDDQDDDKDDIDDKDDLDDHDDDKDDIDDKDDLDNQDDDKDDIDDKDDLDDRDDDKDDVDDRDDLDDQDDDKDDIDDKDDLDDRDNKDDAEDRDDLDDKDDLDDDKPASTAQKPTAQPSLKPSESIVESSDDDDEDKDDLDDADEDGDDDDADDKNDNDDDDGEDDDLDDNDDNEDPDDDEDKD